MASSAEDGAVALGRGPARERGLPVEQLRAFSLIGILLLIWVAFQFLTDGLFLSPRNLTTLSVQVAMTAILAAGIVLMMVQGYIDLSIGSAVAFCGMVATLLVDPTRGWGLTESPFVIIPITIAVGMLIGVWQGVWVAWLGVPSFIVTLASLLALRGAALTITGGSTTSHGGALSFVAASFVPAVWTALFLALIVIGFAARIASTRVSRSRTSTPLARTTGTNAITLFMTRSIHTNMNNAKGSPPSNHSAIASRT